MYFYLIGIDYKKTSLSLRGDLYRRQAEIADFLRQRSSTEAVLLVTCNRIEIYAVSRNPDDAFGSLNEFIKRFPDFMYYAYIKYGQKQVFRHALRLACGLESQLQGELQIFTQLKAWLNRGSFPPDLNDLWDRALRLSEGIRLSSGLNQCAYNIAAVVFYDLRKHFALKERLEIIVAGTGKIAELIVQCKPAHVHLDFLAHRNYIKAVSLADAANGEAFLFRHLSELLPKADALISATSSPHYVFKREHFLNIANKRERPFYLYDLAFPLDIEPAVGIIEGVLLQNLENLSGVIQSYNQANSKAVDFAAALVDESLRIYPEEAYVRQD